VSTFVSFQASFPISLAPQIAADEYNPVILVNLLYIHILHCSVKVPEIMITRQGHYNITIFHMHLSSGVSQTEVKKEELWRYVLHGTNNSKVVFFFSSSVTISVLLWHLNICSNRQSKNEQKESFSKRSGASGPSGLAL